ncbi:restriction endonuclease subunit S [Streptomyces variabilis]
MRADRVALGEVAEIRSGVGFPVHLQGRDDGAYPLAKVGDVSRTARAGRAVMHTADNYVEDEDLATLRTAPFPAGTILFAKIGEAIRQNYRAITGKPFLADNNVMGVTPGGRLDPRYLYHYLRSVDLYPLAQSTTVPSIRKSELARMLIPCPTLPEQRRVVQVMDQVDAMRAKRREAIALFNDLAQSIFLDMFGDPIANPSDWSRVPLGQLLSRIDSGKSPQCLDRPARDEEWGVLKLGAVTQGVYIPSENKALPGSVDPDGRNEVQAGDLLFTRKNTPDLVAAVAYVRETPEKLLLPDLIFRLTTRPDAAVDKVYLHGLLSYPPKRRKIQELATGSAASMPNISKAKLLELPSELPPVELQNRYALRIEKIEQLKAVHVRQLEELDALFDSVRHRAFRGELWGDASVV